MTKESVKRKKRREESKFRDRNNEDCDVSTSSVEMSFSYCPRTRSTNTSTCRRPFFALFRWYGNDLAIRCVHNSFVSDAPTGSKYSYYYSSTRSTVLGVQRFSRSGYSLTRYRSTTWPSNATLLTFETRTAPFHFLGLQLFGDMASPNGDDGIYLNLDACTYPTGIYP